MGTGSGISSLKIRAVENGKKVPHDNAIYSTLTP